VLEEPATLAALGDVAGKDVVDAACGTGRYALRLCVLSFRTHAERVSDAVAALRQEAGALLG
jgi:predicted RNA methylase